MLIAVGTLRLGIDNALPNNVPFSMGQAAGAAAILDLNGHNQQLSSLVSVASAAAPIVTNSSATDALLTLSDGGDYSGTIADSWEHRKDWAPDPQPGRTECAAVARPLHLQRANHPGTSHRYLTRGFGQHPQHHPD